MTATGRDQTGRDQTGRDQNDLAIAGMLPRDPEQETRPVVFDVGVRQLAAKLLGDSAPAEPHDVPAEIAILAALLWCGAHQPAAVSVEQLSDLILGPEVFFARRHQLIYAAMQQLAAEKATTDIVSVHGVLLARNKDRSAGGLEYLERLVEVAESASQRKVRTWASSIADAYARRQLIRAAHAIIADARGGTMRAAEVHQSAATRISEEGRNIVGGGELKTMRAAMAGGWKSAAAAKGAYIPTGIRAIDDAIDGLFPRNTSILAAATSVGKTLLATQIARNIVERDPTIAVLYVTLEMPGEDFSHRMLSAETGVEFRKIRTARLSESERVIMADAARRLAALKIVFADTRPQTMADIGAQAVRVRQHFAPQGVRLALIVIDTIGRVRPSPVAQKRGNRGAELEEITLGMCELAQKHDCHVIGLHHINREGAKREGATRLPRATDIRDSGTIENHVDNVFLLHRDVDSNGMPIEDAPAAFIIGKGRNMSRGYVCLQADPAHGRFLPWDGDPKYFDRR